MTIDQLVRAKRIARMAAEECGIHYAHGAVESWCTRRLGHDGPCRQDHDVNRRCGLMCARPSRATWSIETAHLRAAQA